MAFTDIEAALRKAVFICLLLSSVAETILIPEGKSGHNQPAIMGDPHNAPKRKLQLNSLESSLQDISNLDSAYRHAPYRPATPMDRLANGTLPATGAATKRDAHAHAWSQSCAQALVRIRNPCAGKMTMPYSLEAPPAASNIRFTARHLLLKLATQAELAQRQALQIVGQFEDIGITHPESATEAGPGAPLGYRTAPASNSEPMFVRTLGSIYSQLSRSAFILQQVVNDGGLLTPLIDNLKENSLYNLLCGLKVIMDSRAASFEDSSAEVLNTVRLVETSNDALQLVRNYGIVRDVARVLGNTVNRLTALSQYFAYF